MAARLRPERHDPASITSRRVAIAAALVEGVRTHGLALLPWSDEARMLQARAAFARPFAPDLPDLSDDALLERLDDSEFALPQ